MTPEEAIRQDRINGLSLWGILICLFVVVVVVYQFLD